MTNSKISQSPSFNCQMSSNEMLGIGILCLLDASSTQNMHELPLFSLKISISLYALWTHMVMIGSSQYVVKLLLTLAVIF